MTTSVQMINLSQDTDDSDADSEASFRTAPVAQSPKKRSASKKKSTASLNSIIEEDNNQPSIESLQVPPYHEMNISPSDFETRAASLTPPEYHKLVIDLLLLEKDRLNEELELAQTKMKVDFCYERIQEHDRVLQQLKNVFQKLQWQECLRLGRFDVSDTSQVPRWHAKKVKGKMKGKGTSTTSPKTLRAPSVVPMSASSGVTASRRRGNARRRAQAEKKRLAKTAEAAAAAGGLGMDDERGDEG